MIFGWISAKVVQKKRLLKKTWSPGAGPFFQIWLLDNFENLYLQNHLSNFK